MTSFHGLARVRLHLSPALPSRCGHGENRTSQTAAPARTLGARQLLTYISISTGAGPVATCTRCAGEDAGTFRSASDIIESAQHAVASWNHSSLGPNLALHGPDPFAHPEFERLISGLSNVQAERVCITTAGLGTRAPATAGLLADSGITHIHLMLLADNPQAHDDLTGHPGSFDMAVERCVAFRERCTGLGIPPLLCGDVPVCRHNLAMTPATVAFLATHGVRSITLDTSNAPPTADARAWIDASLDTGIVSGAWVCESPVHNGCTHAGLLGTSPISLSELVNT